MFDIYLALEVFTLNIKGGSLSGKLYKNQKNLFLILVSAGCLGSIFSIALTSWSLLGLANTVVLK